MGQERVNKELPKIGKNIIGKMYNATGWHLNEKGQWEDRPNRITNQSDALDDEKLGIGMGIGIDNFISYQLRQIKLNGKNYFLFIKKYKGGEETSHYNWKITKSVEFIVFDSIRFSRTTTEKLDTISLVEINTIHIGNIKWSPSDTTFISDIENEIAERKPNDGFHDWDVLFRCRLYKEKGLVQFMYYSTYPKLKEIDFESCYYETNINNFKNLFGTELHLNFDNLYTYKVQEKPSEIFTVVEEMPEFNGGQMELTKYIQQNLKSFKIPKDAGFGGKCFIKFVVGLDGTVKDVTVLKGVPNCPQCDEEAKRIMLAMPKWKPGKQNGKAVQVFYNQPINFYSK
jgi:hypothetical protein